MQIPDVLTFAFALVVACAATWGACRWWYGRKLKAAQQKIEKLNHNRALYDQHTAQARRQIEQLNRELTTYRAREQWAPTPAPPHTPSVAFRPASVPPSRAAASPTDLAQLLEAGDRLQAAQPSSHAGWQHTQPGDIGWLPTQQIDERSEAPATSARAASPGRRGFSDTQPA